MRKICRLSGPISSPTTSIGSLPCRAVKEYSLWRGLKRRRIRYSWISMVTRSTLSTFTRKKKIWLVRPDLILSRVLILVRWTICSRIIRWRTVQGRYSNKIGTLIASKLAVPLNNRALWCQKTTLSIKLWTPDKNLKSCLLNLIRAMYFQNWGKVVCHPKSLEAQRSTKGRRTEFLKLTN